MKTFSLTKLLCVFPVLAVAMIAGVAICIPSTVDRFAPYSGTTSECLICEQMQTISQRWMQSPSTSIYTGPDSEWMQSRVDSNHKHWWVGCSSESRSSWFGDHLFGCGGGVGGVSSLHYLYETKGSEIDQPFVEQYLQLTREGDLKSVREFVQTAIMPAFQTPTASDATTE